MSARKPIQMIVVEPRLGVDTRPFLFVLCDDGMIWERSYSDPTGPWKQSCPPIPGSAADPAAIAEPRVAR